MVDLEKVRYPRSDTQTHTTKTNTVVALAQAGNWGQVEAGLQVGVGARLTDICHTLITYILYYLTINNHFPDTKIWSQFLDLNLEIFTTGRWTINLIIIGAIVKR